jgi:hypothetical protein
VGAAVSHGRVTRFFRLLDLNRNPLRRGVDRVEAIALRAAITIFVITLAFIPSVIGHAMEQGAAAEHTQSGTKHRAVAVVVGDPAGSSITMADSGGSRTARARWRAPSGVDVEKSIAVGFKAHRGSKLNIWVDENGSRVAPPWTRAQTVGVAVMEALALPAGVTLTLLMLITVLRRVLDRIRHSRWTAGWAQVGPDWSSHF